MGKGASPINLLFNNDHCWLITRLPAFFRQPFCQKCGIAVKSDHICPHSDCGLCHQTGCNGPCIITTASRKVRCEICGYLAPSEACLKHHQRKEGRKTRCRRFRVCLQCNKKDKKCYFDEAGNHLHCHKHYCQICCKWEDDGHDVHYIQPYKPPEHMSAANNFFYYVCTLLVCIFPCHTFNNIIFYRTPKLTSPRGYTRWF